METKLSQLEQFALFYEEVPFKIKTKRKVRRQVKASPDDFQLPTWLT